MDALVSQRLDELAGFDVSHVVCVLYVCRFDVGLGFAVFITRNVDEEDDFELDTGSRGCSGGTCRLS